MAAAKPPSSLSRYLDGEFWEAKDVLREEVSSTELFQRSSYGLSLEEIRDLTAERLHSVLKTPLMQRHLCDQVTGRKKGFITKSLGITELICAADMATGVKVSEGAAACPISWRNYTELNQVLNQVE
ncbi:hypothetical protein NFI96_003377 [Prochilodus magdalenae]|nr:hypothetical protein NFI96_003377 [Prochilodus magdalenae]